MTSSCPVASTSPLCTCEGMRVKNLKDVSTIIKYFWHWRPPEGSQGRPGFFEILCENIWYSGTSSPWVCPSPGPFICRTLNSSSKNGKDLKSRWTLLWLRAMFEGWNRRKGERVAGIRDWERVKHSGSFWPLLLHSSLAQLPFLPLCAHDRHGSCTDRSLGQLPVLTNCFPVPGSLELESALSSLGQVSTPEPANYLWPDRAAPCGVVMAAMAYQCVNEKWSGVGMSQRGRTGFFWVIQLQSFL